MTADRVLRIGVVLEAFLDGSQAQVISIEHEDPFVPATVGVPEAARLLRAAIEAVEAVAAVEAPEAAEAAEAVGAVDGSVGQTLEPT